MSELLAACKQLVRILEDNERYPFGAPVSGDTQTVAGNACVQLCGGDVDKGRTLWRRHTTKFGYMPEAAAVALIFASDTSNLIPDVTAPEVL